VKPVDQETTGTRKKRSSEEQITSSTSRARPDCPIKELWCTGGFSDATFYR